MTANAGTAYVAIEPDLSGFTKKLSEHLKSIKPVTQDVELRVDEHGLKRILKPLEQKVDVKLDDKSTAGLRGKFSKPIHQTVDVKVDEQQLRKGEDEVRSSAGRISGAMKGAMAGIGVVAVAGFVKSSIDSVTQLYGASKQLHNIAGMNLSDAAQFTVAANAMGIPMSKMQMSIKTLDIAYNSIKNQSKGYQANLAALQALGITQKQFLATGGDTKKIFDLVTSSINKVPPSAERTAAEFKLLGRGASALSGIINDGGKTFNKLQGFAKSLGVQLGGDTAGNIGKARLAQMQMTIVMQAAQLFVVNKLVPAFLSIGKWISSNVIPPIKAVVGWFEKHKTITQALTAVIGPLLVAFVGMKVVGTLVGPFASAFKAMSTFAGGIGTTIKFAKTLVAEGLGPAMKSLGLFGRAAGAASKPVSNLAGDITGLGGKAKTAEGEVGNAAGALQGLGGKAKGAKGEISTVAGEVGNLGGAARGTKGEVKDVETAIQDAGGAAVASGGKWGSLMGFLTGAATKAFGLVAALAAVQVALGKVTGNNLSSAASPSNPEGRISQNQRQAGGTGGATGILSWAGGIIGHIIGRTGGLVTRGGLQRFAAGGFAGYGGGDIIPALLEPGEGILRKEAVKAYGRDTIGAMNRGEAVQAAAPVIQIIGKGVALQDLIDIRVVKGGRKAAQPARMALPSRGGA